MYDPSSHRKYFTDSSLISVTSLTIFAAVSSTLRLSKADAGIILNTNNNDNAAAVIILNTFFLFNDSLPQLLDKKFII